MMKLLEVDTAGDYAYPEVTNLSSSAIAGLMTKGGASLAGKFPDMIFMLSDRPGYPPGLVDYFRASGLHIVSVELKAMLEGAGAELEYFPVTVMYDGLQTPFDYFAANPLRLIAGVMRGSSRVTMHPVLPCCVSVEQLVLDESQFASVKVASVMEIPYIAVEHELSRAMLLAGFLGIAFLDPEDIRY